MTVMDLTKGDWAEIAGVEGDEGVCLRLMEMGFTPGECIHRVGSSPFKTPVVVNIRGSVFALREEEAECIRVSCQQ